MKKSGVLTLSLFFLGCFFVFSPCFSQTVSRSIHETIDLGTSGEEPGPGGGRYFPGGSGLWGTQEVRLEGTSSVYSYDPSLYPIPPTETSDMGPGHVGTNEKIYMSGSAKVTGMVNVPQSIVDEVLAQD